MNTQPLITVIVATYNSANTLSTCIDSVLNQTYSNIEFIIIDGGSTDDTVNIIKAYSSKINFWLSEPDNGVYDAWNKGLAKANGDWITFIGSDDELYPDAFESYVNYINASATKFDLISSRADIINKHNEIIRSLGWPWEWDKSKKVFTIAHPGALHAKALFEKNGLFNIKYKISGDYEFLLRCGKDMKAGYINKPTIRMALGGLSDTHKVLRETYRIIRNTGEISQLTAAYIYVLQTLKYGIRKSLRSIGVNIALKK